MYILGYTCPALYGFKNNKHHIPVKSKKESKVTEISRIWVNSFKPHLMLVYNACTEMLYMHFRIIVHVNVDSFYGIFVFQF